MELFSPLQSTQCQHLSKRTLSISGSTLLRLGSTVCQEMEPININNSLDEARSFRAQLLSLGYGIERATATAIANQWLSDGTLKLNQLSSEQELKGWHTSSGYWRFCFSFE